MFQNAVEPTALYPPSKSRAIYMAAPHLPDASSLPGLWAGLERMQFIARWLQADLLGPGGNSYGWRSSDDGGSGVLDAQPVVRW